MSILVAGGGGDSASKPQSTDVYPGHIHEDPRHRPERKTESRKIND